MKTPKLKLACADFTFPLLPHAASLDLIAAIGLDGVDIGLFEGRGHLQPSRELKNVRKSGAALRRALDARGIELADMFLIPATDFSTLAPNHPDRRVRRRARDQFERLVDYTAHCGGRHVTALPGVHWPDESRADSFARSTEELGWRVEHAKRHGLTYAVEPHIGSIIPSPAEAQRIVARTPGLTLTLDYGHFTRVGTPDREIEPLIEHASHFHCRGACRGRLQASFKRNTIDYGRVLSVMRQTDYSGFIGLEYVWIDWEHCNEVDNLSETILFRDYLRRGMR